MNAFAPWFRSPPPTFEPPLPPSAVPFWGPVTANYDWCESNYAVSQYVAEFFNSISSLPTFTVGKP